MAFAWPRKIVSGREVPSVEGSGCTRGLVRVEER